MDTVSTMRHWAISVAFGLASGASYAIRASGSPLLSPSTYLASGVGIGLAYLALTHILRPAWREWRGRVRWAALGLSVFLATAASMSLHRPPGIVWRYYAGGDTWRPVGQSVGTTWGQSRRVLSLHGTDQPNDGGSYGPWRAAAELSGVLSGAAKRFRLSVTQPEEGLLLPETGQIAPPGYGDGVTVVFKLERPEGWMTAHTMHLDAINQPQHRRWHTVELEAPADSGRLVIEVLAGPPGSNTYFDSLWVSLESVAPAGRREFTWLRVVVDLTSLSFLGLAGLGLVFRLSQGLSRSRAFTPHQADRADSTDKHPSELSLLLAYALPVLAILPSLVWVALDRSAWGGDQSQYGRASLELFYTLIHYPAEWPRLMLDVFFKPPAIFWVGQLFVPLGHLVGSIDKGLLLSVLVTQALVLVLMYTSVLRISGKASVATAGCLAIASAPLFVAFASQYMVESIQTLAVAWFILIMCSASGWSRAFTLSQLLAASAFAMLTKASTPLFCLWPGLVAAACAFLPRRAESGSVWRPRAGVLRIALALAVSIATGAWYYRNMQVVTAHVSFAAFGPMAPYWGAEDTVWSTMIYWLDFVRSTFFLPGIPLFALGILVGGVICCFRASATKPFTLCGAVAGLQILTVLLIFSLSPNRAGRLILPLLPYLVLLICWGLAQIDRPLVTAVATVAFVAQFGVVHAQALGLLPNIVDSPIRPINSTATDATILSLIVDRTCAEKGDGTYENILALDTCCGRDWLAPEPANYVAARNAFPHEQPPCHYGYAGGNYFGSSANEAWNLMLSNPTLYFITRDPEAYSVPPNVHNQTLNQHNLPKLLNKIRTSGLFEPETPLPEDPSILIFRRIDPVSAFPTNPNRPLIRCLT